VDTRKYSFTAKGSEALEKFLSFFPHISRSFHKTRLLQALEAAAGDGTAAEISEDSVVRAFELLYPTFTTFTLAVKDPSRLSATVAAQKTIDAASPLMHITRWSDMPSMAFPGKVEDVFAFLAGPRIGGNTDVIMDSVLAGAQAEGAHIEKCCFSNLSIKPCMGCMACKSGKLETCCSIKDDMERLYHKFQECDAFVLGFPIYSGRESSHLAVFLDRLFALSDPWGRKQLKKRRGLIVATWGWPSPEAYVPVIHNIAFILSHFGVETIEVVTGCGFWDAYYGKGTAGLVPEKIEAAKNAGRALVLP